MVLFLFSFAKYIFSMTSLQLSPNGFHPILTITRTNLDRVDAKYFILITLNNTINFFDSFQLANNNLKFNMFTQHKIDLELPQQASLDFLYSTCFELFDEITGKRFHLLTCISNYLLEIPFHTRYLNTNNQGNILVHLEPPKLYSIPDPSFTCDSFFRDDVNEKLVQENYTSGSYEWKVPVGYTRDAELVGQITFYLPFVSIVYILYVVYGVLKGNQSHKTRIKKEKSK